jgi:hypothetical protein
MREALEAVQAKQADDHQNLIDLAIVASLLITLLLVWLLQEKRHSSKLVLAHKDTENANIALNLLKDNLEKLIRDSTLQLTKSENQYRGLVESLEDKYVFYQHDSQGFIQYISPSVTHRLGHQVSGFGSNYRQYLTDNPNSCLIAKFVERSLIGEHVPHFEIEVFDELAGLINRYFFKEILEAKIKTTWALEQPMALLF